ncbi:cysteine hydrolase [bacterium]|nr:cysteine hydrolase [bacterium]
MAELDLKLRHYHFDFGEGQLWLEENTRAVESVRSFKPQEMALILVDCWDRHYLKSFLARSDQIIRECIVPLRDACHEIGITVVHAPSPAQAKRYPQWLQYAGDEELFSRQATSVPDWPPPGFRSRSGEYQQFAKQPGAVVQAWRVVEADQRRIAPELEPQDGEFVIATGRQLHRLLRHRKILHLLYAGFAANMCVLARDYGMRAMHHRGYNTILLRDCTTGIEAHDTVGAQALTRAAVLEAEMLLDFTADSQDLRAAIRRCLGPEAPDSQGGSGGTSVANGEFVRRLTGRVARK